MMSLLLMLAGAAAMPSAATAQSLAIVHAKAWTMQSATPVPNATIVVEDGRILSVREAGVVPPGVQVIDAAGMPVTPGFMNAATQIGLIEVIAAQETRDTAAPAGKDARRGALGPSFDISFALNGNSALVALARADGLTSALSFPSVSGVAPFAGQAAIVRLRDGADILDRARTAMFVVIGGGAWDKAAESRAAQWQLLRGALDEARVPRPVAGGEEPLLNRRDAAAVRPILAGTMPLAIVTHRESDIRQAIRLAADYRIRVVIVGGAEAWWAAAALAAAHIPVVLDPEANLPVTFDQLGARQDNAAILARAGVTVAFGLAGGVLEQDYNAGLPTAFPGLKR